MFKFLRRYNKWILAVGGTLLMISFLIMDAIPRFSQSVGAMGASQATVGEGEKVSAHAMEEAADELRIMKEAGLGLPALGLIDKKEHWYLLVREAQNAGLVGTSGAVGQQVVLQVASRARVRDLRAVQRLVAHLQGVRQMLDLYSTGNLYSDRRIRSEAERLMHMLTVRLVVLKASAERAQPEDEPTEQQVSDQLRAYADKLPGEGEMGFGYKLPDRVKIEWLTIPVADVRAIVEASGEFNGVALRTHWLRNPDKKFPPPPEGDGAAPVPQEVRDDLLDKLTRQKLQEIAQYANDALRLNRRGLPERDGYVELPPDWPQRMLRFPMLAQDLQKRFGLSAVPHDTAGDRWLAMNELDELPGIGQAQAERLGPTPLKLSRLASFIQELGQLGAAPIQKNIAGPPLRGADGSVYLFRITAIDPSHAPQSIDEVRDAIVSDLKRLAEYHRLEAQADSLKQEAESEGLLGFAIKHQTVVQPDTPVYLCNPRTLLQFIQFGMPVQVTPAYLPEIGSHRPTVERIIDAGLALPLTQPVEELPLEQRLLVVPVKDRLSMVAVEILAQIPLSQELFEALVKDDVMQRLLASEEADAAAAVRQAFNLEALTKRHNFAWRNEERRSGSKQALAGETLPRTAVN